MRKQIQRQIINLKVYYRAKYKVHTKYIRQDTVRYIKRFHKLDSVNILDNKSNSGNFKWQTREWGKTLETHTSEKEPVYTIGGIFTTH